jgi:hypothetical protein
MENRWIFFVFILIFGLVNFYWLNMFVCIDLRFFKINPCVIFIVYMSRDYVLFIFYVYLYNLIIL